MSRLYATVTVLVLLLAHTAYSQHLKQSQHSPSEISVKTFFDKSGALTTRSIAGQRELSSYDDGGQLDCRRYNGNFTSQEQTAARVATWSK